MILNKKIPLKYWLNNIKKELFIVTIFSTFIFFLTKYIFKITVPSSIGAFLITAISLLLSFKLSQSYDRWWEARKIWGAIVNDSRSFVVQLKNFTKDTDNEIVKRMALRQIAWCYSLSLNLRMQDPLYNIEEFICKDELESLKNKSNVPLSLLDTNTDDLSILHKEKIINDYQQVQIDKTIVRLCASMGKAERIKNTSFPKTYRETLYIFIFITLISLSFAFSNMSGFLEIPVIVIIAIPFFLLDKIAKNIQDPFENRPTDTPMTSISRTIEINIKQQMGLENIPEPIISDKFYVL
jgi:putative membrane protein